MVLENIDSGEKSAWQDTAIPLSGRTRIPAKEEIPEPIRRMRRLYIYGRESLESKAENFYAQGMLMKDYEDDAPWSGDVVCYFPTYHDLTVKQLRGYFSWRTYVRKGDYRPISASFAYIYIYELLNGIGTGSPEDTLEKLKEFEKGFLDSGIGDERIRKNLRRWMLDCAVINELPAHVIRNYMDPEMLAKDLALAVLKEPEHHTAKEISDALILFGGKKISNSPIFSADQEKACLLLGEIWKTASGSADGEQKGLFERCFGQMITRRWYPLSNAVYCGKNHPKESECIVDPCRIYRFHDGIWQSLAYENLFFDKNLFFGLLHEADLLLRRYLKTGHYLHEKPSDAWAVPYISRVIEADRAAVEEAMRPKITIDLNGLDRIRRDAETTKNSLLTEEELKEDGTPTETEEKTETEILEELPEEETDLRDAGPEDPGIALTAIEKRIIQALLVGEDTAELIRENHLMPAILADSINEAFYGEIGDNVVCSEDDILSLVEDYREEVEELL